MRVRSIGSLNAEVRLPRLAINIARYALSKGGILGSSLAQLIGYARLTPDAASADIQFIGSPTTMRAVGRPERKEMKLEPDVVPGASLGCYVCRPRSRGSTHIASTAIDAPPKIVLNHLTDEHDQWLMVQGLRLCRWILEQPSLDDVRVEIASPATSLQTHDQLLSFARTAGGSAYHVAGSCRMGHDEDCVVDSQLRVHGLERLRVIDSSIMPRIVSANTHAATVAIAEKGAELVLASARRA
jgi:choline dehydrogenase